MTSMAGVIEDAYDRDVPYCEWCYSLESDEGWLTLGFWHAAPVMEPLEGTDPAARISSGAIEDERAFCSMRCLSQYAAELEAME